MEGLLTPRPLSTSPHPEFSPPRRQVKLFLFQEKQNNISADVTVALCQMIAPKCFRILREIVLEPPMLVMAELAQGLVRGYCLQNARAPQPPAASTHASRGFRSEK